ncbi:MAG: HEAT repeat domain-containing protein [Verrucomicrobia bacterium]|nr:HEAT repeat domain-containing protein [Verrucomicrobiota bacterium]
MSEQLDKAVEALKTYDWGVDPNVLKPIDDAIISTHSDAAARKELETRLIAVLKTEVPRAAKDAVCRVLKTIGTAASVPALAAMLADEKLSHMARYALERIPAPEAGQAMREALPKVSAKLKIGILSSLGVRGEATALPALQALLADSDAAVAAAAAHALGGLGSMDAAKALVTAKPSAGTSAAIADASLECAENLVAAGNKPAAKITYEKLLASSPAKPVKDAATRGLKACDK